jgi:hypothetical protein
VVESFPAATLAGLDSAAPVVVAGHDAAVGVVEFDRPVVEGSGIAAGHDVAAESLGSLGVVVEPDRPAAESSDVEAPGTAVESLEVAAGGLDPGPDNAPLSLIAAPAGQSCY